ncbi:MAG: iron complex transport system substrate-binding protein [Methylophagaceae bacterium]|jgi:iron complex transport system substrate-binding protein
MKAAVATLLLLMATHVYAETPKRIITIGGALTEIVYALGEQSRLVGNDTTSLYPKEAVALPKIGYQRALSSEGILSLTPDVIILTNEAGPPTVIRQLEATGVRILKLKAGRSIDDVKHSVNAIGKILDRQQEAKTLVAKLDKDNQQLATITQAIKTHQKVMFVLQHTGGAPLVAGTETAADSIIKMSGGVNVVTGYQGYKPLTPEAAVILKPDVILITNLGLEQAGGKQELLKSPGLSLTPAAKYGNVIAMDSLLILGFGPRTVEAAMALNQAYDNL